MSVSIDSIEIQRKYEGKNSKKKPATQEEEEEVKNSYIHNELFHISFEY